MKRLWIVIICLVVVVIASFSRGYGQQEPASPIIEAQVIEIQPFEQEFQQQIALSVTLSISTSTGMMTQTVTLPVVLDMNLSFDMSNSGSVPISPAGPVTLPPDDGDLTGSASDWDAIVLDDSTEVVIDDVEGQNEGDLAIDFAYNLESDRPIILSKSLRIDDLAGGKGISFDYRGEGASNALEVKFIIRDPEKTQFGYASVGQTNVQEWTSVEILFSEFECWNNDSPDSRCDEYGDSLDVNTLIPKQLEIVIVSDDETPNEGNIIVDNIRVIE